MFENFFPPSSWPSVLPPPFPKWRPEVNGLHWLAGMSLIPLTAVLLVPPPTQGWKMLRIGMTPLIIMGWVWCQFGVHQPNDEDQWGATVLFVMYITRTLELLVFWPPEENVFRVRRRAPARLNGSTSGQNGTQHHLTDGSTVKSSNGRAEHHEHQQAVEEVLPEPVPAPWTMAKFGWALSLWWSLRGIGWNYCCPLPSSSRRHPFTVTSSRRSYIIYRLRYYVAGWIVWDLTRSYMNCSTAAPYFNGLPGVAPTYESLNQWQRGVYSLCVACRIIFGCEKTHTGLSMILVAIGGLMGWDNEIFSPWGWPPLFGTLSEVWKNPGLAVTWTKIWQGYMRRWLVLFGVHGIGETILRLPPSGPSVHPRIMDKSAIPPSSSESTTPDSSGKNSPAPSGRTSPFHPMPSDKAPPSRRLTTKSILSNTVKSFIVFTLSGLTHDIGTFNLIWGAKGSNFEWREVFVLTPFFAVQPIAIVLEAVVKGIYRRTKRRVKPEWTKAQPKWLTFVERLLGFVWTWVFLGWSAKWFVDGMTKIGVFRRGDGRPEFPSLIGGLVWGKWKH